MFNSFSNFIIYFMFYSFLGWIFEVMYFSIISKKFINRGFFTGPYLPTYGFGAIIIITILKPFIHQSSSILIFFITSVLVTSTIKFLTSFIIEKLFNIRLWDYSNNKFNLNGRICIKNSILSGLLCLILIYVINPFIADIVSGLSAQHVRVIGSLFNAILLIDLTITLNYIYHLDNKAKKVKHILKSLEGYNDKYNWLDIRNVSDSIVNLEKICIECNDKDSLDFVDQLDYLLSKDKTSFRFLKAFPSLAHTKHKDIFTTLKHSIEQMHEKAEVIKDNFSSRVLSHFKKFHSSNEKATENNKQKSFASDFNFYKLFWIFFIGSILGFIVETTFCFYKYGYIESRQGLLYGPFSQIYGFGAILLAVLLKRFEGYSNRFIFTFSAFVGGAYEFLSSIFQEVVFGTVSWQYSKEEYGILNGRTSLLYMLFWGFLGTFFIKLIYPALSKFIEKLPNSGGKQITWMLFVILLLDGTLSSAALYRWKERVDGKPAHGILSTFIDNNYDNVLMEQIYSSMIPNGKQ